MLYWCLLLLGSGLDSSALLGSQIGKVAHPQDDLPKVFGAMPDAKTRHPGHSNSIADNELKLAIGQKAHPAV
jgi:hypothetical protein